MSKIRWGNVKRIRGLGLVGVVILLSCGASERGDDGGTGGTSGSGGSGASSGSGATSNVYVAPIATGCLPRTLPMQETGSLACDIIEAELVNAGGCSCTAESGRAGVDPRLDATVRETLGRLGVCDGPMLPTCQEFCLCEIRQFSGEELRACQTLSSPPGDPHGFCYVSPVAAANAVGDDGISASEQEWIDAQAELSASCPVTDRSWIRLLGDGIPKPDSPLLAACDTTLER